MATTTVNFQQIAAAFISANNPDGVREALVANGIVSDMATANAMSEQQLAQTLYRYYLLNGGMAYAQLLQSIPTNRNANNWTTDQNKIIPAVNDLSKVGIVSVNPTGKADWFSEFWNGIVGSSSSTISPVVSTTTKLSSVAIGFIIGGVLMLGILAYVIVKS